MFQDRFGILDSAGSAPKSKNHFAMRSFESEFALHLRNKIQLANCDRFGPPTFSRHSLTRESIRLSIGGVLAEIDVLIFNT